MHNAALGLAFFSRTEARPVLLLGTQHPETYSRWESVFSLRTIGSVEVAEAIIPMLDPAVEPDDGVRGEVALALGGMGEGAAVLALLGPLAGPDVIGLPERPVIGRQTRGGFGVGDGPPKSWSPPRKR